jgi:hypothetical protein
VVAAGGGRGWWGWGSGRPKVRVRGCRVGASVRTVGGVAGGEVAAGRGGGGGRNEASEEEEDAKWASLGRAVGCVLISQKEDRSPPNPNTSSVPLVGLFLWHRLDFRINV